MDVDVTGSIALASKIKCPMYIVDWVMFFPTRGDVISTHTVVSVPMFRVPLCISFVTVGQTGASSEKLTVAPLMVKDVVARASLPSGRQLS